MKKLFFVLILPVAAQAQNDHAALLKQYMTGQNKYFQFNGNILVAEVRGGVSTVKQAFRNLSNYVGDYGRQSPALPFESLVTDRLKETDTTKWVTKLYFPVY